MLYRGHGDHVPTLEHMDEWLHQSGLGARPKDMARADMKRFVVKFPMLRDVLRPAVRRCAASLMNDDGLAPLTVQRALSAPRGRWRYLPSMGVVSETEEPFTHLGNVATVAY